MQCTYRYNGVRCCLRARHVGSDHKFKCAGDYCPGMKYPASIAAHPHECMVGWGEDIDDDGRAIGQCPRCEAVARAVDGRWTCTMCDYVEGRWP